MKKEPVYFNEETHKAILASFEFGKQILQKAIDAYMGIDGMSHLTNDEFKSLLLNPEKFISEVIIKKHDITFEGLSVKAEKVFELFDKPKGTNECLNAIKTLFNDIESFKQSREFAVHNITVNTNDFVVHEGVISLKEEALAAAKESCSVYLKTDKQQQIFDHVIAIKDSFNRIKHLMGDRLDSQKFIKDAYGVDVKNFLSHDQMDFVIQPNFINDLTCL
jgi:hypothetical protein